MIILIFSKCISILVLQASFIHLHKPSFFPPNRFIMKSFFASLILAIICLTTTSAFSVNPSAVVSTVSGPSSTSLNVFGNRKSQAQKEDEVDSKYWQGEWVCKDCGYIYNRVRSFIHSVLAFFFLLPLVNVEEKKF